jgi:hypothetical protein
LAIRGHGYAVHGTSHLVLLDRRDRKFVEEKQDAGFDLEGIRDILHQGFVQRIMAMKDIVSGRGGGTGGDTAASALLLGSKFLLRDTLKS